MSGELLSKIDELGGIDEVSAHFFTAEIVLALEWLHNTCHIIHRDVKVIKETIV